MEKPRKSRRGQTLLIAYAKCIGTLCATGYGGIMAGYQLATVLGIFCLVFDVIYIVMLGSEIKKERLL